MDSFTKSPEINFHVDVGEDINHGTWNIIPIDENFTKEEKRIVHRLNGLGSLFYFSKVILRNRRLQEHLHLDLALQFENEYLKELLEFPRDHFKSTLGSESAPIWWGLPFTDRDENFMRQFGYGDVWIRWMKRAHDQDTRTLLVSENITNAAKLGVRIDGHYYNNDLFRYLFPEIIPDSSCTWSSFTKTHKRSGRSKPHGEGTFDYIGVGGALQSRHYDRIVQDDLVGKEASESEAIMTKTIDYHKLLVGAFDSHQTSRPEQDNDEIVIGNRWAYNDLNSWIRENEPYFRITNHSALGGCCPKHTAGLPIFPEEFTLEKLERWQRRLGTYLFSCQFLNSPTTPQALAFDVRLLRYYTFTKEDLSNPKSGVIIRHEVENGEAIPDVSVRELAIQMICDPNHSQEDGRCNHAISVVGQVFGHTKEVERAYLLDCWADSTSYDRLLEQIYFFADKWKLREFYLETIAAQVLLKYHIEFRNKISERKLKVIPLKTSRSKNAKLARIQALGPTFENRQFWCRRGNHVDFIKEYSLFPNLNKRDILDTLGYWNEIRGKAVSRIAVADYYKSYQPQVGAGPCGY